jgi:hypothetical protein
MAGAVKQFIIWFGVFRVFPTRDTRLATLTAQLIPVLFAVVSLVFDHGAVPERGGEFWGGGMITDISGGDHNFRRQPQEGVTSGVDFSVETAPGRANGLPFAVNAPTGVLMSFTVGTVHKNHFGVVPEDEAFVQPIEEAVAGETIEVLEHCKPRSEFIRQRPPATAVDQQIPQRVKMLIKGGPPPSCMHKVVVSGPPLSALIFLAARGAVPAWCDDRKSWLQRAILRRTD